MIHLLECKLSIHIVSFIYTTQKHAFPTTCMFLTLFSFHFNYCSIKLRIMLGSPIVPLTPQSPNGLLHQCNLQRKRKWKNERKKVRVHMLQHAHVLHLTLHPCFWWLYKPYVAYWHSHMITWALQRNGCFHIQGWQTVWLSWIKLQSLSIGLCLELTLTFRAFYWL